MRPFCSPWLRLALLLTLLVCAPGLQAAPLTLDLLLRPAESLLEGEARWTLRNQTGRPLHTIPLRLYANRFASPPLWLDGPSWFRVYPGGFDPGWTEVERAEVNGVVVAVPPADGTRLDLVLPSPLPEGAEVEIALRFRTRVPKRWGLFGAVDGGWSLEEGYYPAPTSLGPGGSREQAPPPVSAALLRLRSEVAGEVLVAGQWRRLRPGGAPVEVAVPEGLRRSLRWAPRLVRLRCAGCDEAWKRAVELIHPPPARPAPVALGQGARDPHTGGAAWDRAVELGRVDTEGEILRTAARALGYLARERPALIPERLRMVIAPLRRQLAQAGEGVLWLSDRLLRVTPSERLRRFHRAALVRAVYEELLRRTLRAQEDARDRSWVAGLLAEHLARRFVRAAWGEEEDAFDLLAPGAFLVVVDDILYAPQMPFQSAYFRLEDDTDPARAADERRGHGRPGARRLYGELRERLGEESLARRLEEALDAGLEGVPTRLRERFAELPAGFFDDGPREHVDRPGEGPLPGPLKVLLGQLYLSASPTANAVSAQAELVFQRRHDLRHRVGLLPFVAPEKMGAALSYAYGFGPAVTPNRLAAAVSASVRGAAIADEGAWGPGLAAQLGLSFSDQVTAFDMQEQNTAYAAIRYLLHPRGDRLAHGGQVELYGDLLRSPHPRHGLGARLSLASSFGQLADSELLSVGGLSHVRGLGPSEWRARHRAVLGLEYRHTWTRSLDVSVLRLAWWEGLQGALFLDAALAAPSLRALFDEEAVALSVGYGLRFHATLLGIQPALLAVDLAYPLPLSERLRGRQGPPLALHVHFTQSF